MSTSIPASIQISKSSLWLGFLLTPFLLPLTIAVFFILDRVYSDPWSITWHSVEHFITGDFLSIMTYGLSFTFPINMLIALITWRIKAFVLDGLNFSLVYMTAFIIIGFIYLQWIMLLPIIAIVITLMMVGIMTLGFCWITGLPFAYSTANSAKR